MLDFVIVFSYHKIDKEIHKLAKSEKIPDMKIGAHWRFKKRQNYD